MHVPVAAANSSNRTAGQTSIVATSLLHRHPSLKCYFRHYFPSFHRYIHWKPGYSRHCSWPYWMRSWTPAGMQNHRLHGSYHNTTNGRPPHGNIQSASWVGRKSVIVLHHFPTCFMFLFCFFTARIKCQREMSFYGCRTHSSSLTAQIVRFFQIALTSR